LASLRRPIGNGYKKNGPREDFLSGRWQAFLFRRMA
jgi:hypothetical protein